MWLFSFYCIHSSTLHIYITTCFYDNKNETDILNIRNGHKNGGGGLNGTSVIIDDFIDSVR